MAHVVVCGDNVAARGQKACKIVVAPDMLRDAVDDLYDGLRLALWRPESAAELSAAVRCNVEFLILTDLLSWLGTPPAKKLRRRLLSTNYWT